MVASLVGLPAPTRAPTDDEVRDTMPSNGAVMGVAEVDRRDGDAGLALVTSPWSLSRLARA